MAYFYEDLSIGDVFVSPARTITETDVVMYSALSGDYNPLHTDEEYAKKTAYGKRMAHGLLGLTYVGGLLNRTGVFDGTTIAFLGLEWTFKGPIFIGDTVHVEFTITELRKTSKPGQGFMKRRLDLINQKNEVVHSGFMSMLIKCKEDGV